MNALIHSDNFEVVAVQEPLESDTDFYNRVQQLAYVYNLRIPGQFDVDFKESEDVSSDD